MSSEPSEKPAPTKEKGSSMILIILGALILVLLIFIAALFLSPLGKKFFGNTEASGPDSQQEHKEINSHKDKTALDPKTLTYVTISEMLINLKPPAQSTDARGGFLKISVNIELRHAHDKEVVEALKPRIIDQMQLFLRNLDSTDLEGSKILRIQQELLNRVKAIATPVDINDVLIKDLLVQ